MSNPTSPPNERASSAGRRRGPNRRQLLTSTAGGVASVSLAGCLGSYDAIVGSSRASETITIGVLAPQPESNYIGRSIVRAAQVAVDDLNDEGGIDGTDVDVAVGNTDGSALEARRQYQRLILEEDADVTVGISDSAALLNLMDEMAEQETIHLTTGAATTAASEAIRDDYERYKYHFRAGPTNNHHLGRAQLDFLDDMAGDIGWDSVAVLVEDYSWADLPWDLYHDESDGIEATGLEVVMDERYPPSTNDFSDFYGKIVEQGADAVIIGAAHGGTTAMSQWSRGELPFDFGGIHLPMQLPSYYRATEGDCRYGFGLTSATAQSEFTGTQAFAESYQTAYDSRPVYTGYHTYDAINVFASAVEETGSLDSDELVPALETTTHQGTVGTVEFYDRDADYPHDLVYNEGDTLCFQWQDAEDGDGGVQEVVWPDGPATADFERPNWLESSN